MKSGNQVSDASSSATTRCPSVRACVCVGRRCVKIHTEALFHLSLRCSSSRCALMRAVNAAAAGSRRF